MANPNHPSFEHIQEIRKQLRDAEYLHWRYHDLHTVNIWLLLIVAVVPWIVWWRITDRSRIYELLAYGLFLGLISTVLDSVGTNLLLWGYKDQIFSISPPLYPADTTLMSVPFMILYQKYSHWKSFFLAVVCLSAFYSFVGEPLLEWLDIYELSHWKHIYSFPIYILLPMLIRWIVLHVQRPRTTD